MKKIKESRCPNCNSLLFKYDYYDNLHVRIRCQNCKSYIAINTKGELWNE